MNQPRTRVQRRPVHGVVLLDKPLGLSSNDALQKVKWLLRAEKAGHTGTLDPLATGVLPLCFGAATKFSQLHLDANKSYEAIAQLGVKTSTGDAEGEVIATRPVQVTDALLANAILQFTGAIQQIPPMHSALKKDGKALYEYARAGIEVERVARDVVILSLTAQTINDPQTEHALKLIVSCSKGTYIRTLAEDIGETLGCGAHLRALRRTATGLFDISHTVSLAQLEAMSEDQRLASLLPVDALLSTHSTVELPGDEAGRFLSGLRRRGTWQDLAQIAVYAQGSGALLGTAHSQAGELIADRLLSPIEIEQIHQQKAATTQALVAQAA